MAATSQIYYLTQTGLGSIAHTERLSFFNSDVTGTQTTVSTSLVLDHPQEFAVDTAAGLFFAIVATSVEFGQGSRLLVGSLATGNVITSVSFSGVDSGDESDDPLVFALAVDPVLHRVYVGIQDAVATAGASGIFRYDYTPSTGALGAQALVIGSNSKPDEPDGDIFSPSDFALDSATGNLFFVERLAGGANSEGVWRLNVTTNTLTQIVAQTQFPDDHSAGFLNSIAVDPSTQQVYFTVHSGPAPGDPGFNAALSKIFVIAGNAAAGTTATQLTLTAPSANFYPQEIAVDPAGFLYVTSEEGNGGAANDVVYKFQLSGGGTTATLVSTINPSPAFTNDDNNFADLVINPIPSLTVSGTAIAVSEQSAAVTLLTGQPTITDLGGGYLSGATVVVGGAGNFQFSDDTLAATVGGTSITASFNAANETLTLSGYDTIANYRTVLASVTLASTGDNPTNGGASTTRTITWTVSDGATGVSAGSQNSTTSTINITALNDAPVHSLPGPQTGTEDGSLVFSSGNANAITISDPDAGSNDVTVTLSANHGTVTLGGTAGLSSVTGNGTVSVVLTGPLSAINTALNGTTYTFTPNYSGSATLTVSTNDNGFTGTGAQGDFDTVAITVTAVNDAPVLDNTKTPVLVGVATTAAPSGAVGTLVSDLINNTSPAGGLDNFTDVDGPGIGIALTGTDSANGTWHYSINGGTNWNLVGVVSDSSARLLLADANTRLYFQPNVGFSGSVPTAITFRAWDASAGSNGGVDTTASTAFSTATDTAAITVVTGNQPPTSTNLSGDNASWSEGESPKSLDVGSNATFADIDSTNFDTGTLTVSLASPLAQDALVIGAIGTVTSTASTVSVGGIQIATYTGGGFGGGPLVFTFDPDATPAAVQQLVRAIQYDNNAGDTPTASTRAVTWTLVDGDGTANGGIDTLVVTSNLTVIPINDAPVLDDSKSPVLAGVNEDAPAPSGAVGTLVSALVDSTTPVGGLDNFTDVDGLAAGITITATNTANGTVFYSVNNGASWQSVGVVSDASALQLDAAARIYFQPAANFNGTVSDAITFRAWDFASGSSGLKLPATPNGGASAFSTVTDTVSITVTPVNDAPVIGGLANVNYTEQAAAQTVAPTLTLNDPDNANLTGATATLTDPVTGDALALSGALPGGITLSGASTATSIVLTGTASVADYQAALRLVTFANPGDNPTLNGTDNTRIVQFTATDGTATSLAGNNGIIIDAVNDAPVNSVPLTTQTVLNTGSLAFTAGNGNLISTSDPDASSLTLTLTFTNGTLNSSSGAITSGNGIVDSIANLNTLLASLVFTPTSGYTGPATLTVATSDNSQTGTGGAKLDSDTININVISNAAPVLDASKSPVLATIAEDAAAPSGAVGTLVSELVDLASPAGQLDNVTDADGPGLGIAITATNSASGTLRYSTDGGATWFAVNPVSTASALLLPGTARLHFQPAANFSGTVSDAVTFRAWDTFSGTATSGSTRGTADTTTSGGATAFSAATDTAAITVSPVNDAPVNTLPATFSTSEDTPLVLAGISAADIDDNGTVQVTFQAGSGRLTVNTAVPGGVIAGDLSGNNTGTIIITATLAQINATLANASGLTFTPNADFTGNTSLAMFIVDLSSLGQKTDLDSATITVTPVNDAPVLDATKSPVLATIAEDAAAPSGAVGTLVSELVDLASPAGQLDNVTDADGPGLGIAITATNSASGTLRYSTDGGATWFAVNPVSTASALLLPGTARLHFQPAANFNGTVSDAITFRAWDTFSGTATNGATRGTADTTTSGGATAFSSNTDTAAITVSPVNDAPAGTNKTVTTNEDTVFVFTAADFGFADPIDSPAHALLAVKVAGLPATGTLRLDGVAVTAGQTVAAADIAAGKLTYAPPANANGSALTSFTFQVQDNGGTANGGVDLDPSANTITIDVTAVNDAPVNTVPGAVATAEDVALAFTGLSAISVSDIDVGGGNLNVTLTVTNGTATIGALNGATVIGGTNGTANMVLSGTPAQLNLALASLTYAPTANFTGNASLTVFTSDLGNTGTGGAQSATSVIPITVNPVNDAPAGTNKIVTTNEDTAFVFTAADFGFTDPADSPANALLAVKVAALPGTGTLRLDGVAVSAGQTVQVADITAGKLTYAPPANANGSGLTSFTFQVQDNGGTANGGVDLDPSANTITIDVTAVNDAPVNTVPGAVATAEDVALAFTGPNAISVADIDVGGGNLNVTLTVTNGTLNIGALGGATVTGGTNGSASMVLSGTSGAINAALATLTYAPTANFAGSALLTVLTSDLGNTGTGGVLTDTDTVAITVSPVNDAPVAPATQSIALVEDAGSSGPRPIGASDADGDVLTYAIKPGSVPAKGVVSFDQGGGTFTYAPFLNANGADAFVILVSDGKGGVAEQAVQVAIAPVNDAPFANPDAFATVGGVPLTLSAAQLLANDGDIDGGPLVVQAVASATGGTVSLAGTAITFTPAAGFSGAGGFDYQISDPQGGTAVARVTVTVGAGNRAPIVDGSQAVTTIENADRTFTVSATDPDGDPLSFSATAPAHGTVVGGPGGVFTYQPVTGFSGTDNFTVAVSDGKGGTAFQAVTVTVLDVPEATGFRLFTNAGWTGSVGGSGTVNGSNGHERVAIVDQAGTIAFDGSFTRGNDVIALSGNASAWQVMRLSGSAALLSDGDTFVQLAVGLGTAIEFADGVRILAFNAAGTMAIGGQAIGTNLAAITALPSGTAPGGDDSDAFARLFLSNGTSASAGGHLLVIGSNNAETLRLLDGDVQLDGSFTRGNDRLVFDFAASTYEASRNGAQLHLTGHGLDLTTPSGTGLLLDFTDSDRLLAFTGSQMTIGTQAITNSPAFLIA